MLRFLLLLSLVLVSAAGPLFAQVPPPPPPASPIRCGEITSIVERMPLFPGYDAELPRYAQQKRQADSLLIDYIYTHLDYANLPASWSEPEMVVISFIVEADGEVTHPRIVRDAGAGAGEEALRVVCNMAAEHRWTPGIQGTRNVRVQFNLPVKFSGE